MRESGYLLLATGFQWGAPTATVSICNGSVTVSEKEVALTGVYLINAKDMNDAIRTAGNMPQARLGTIEVRAVVSLDTP